MSDPTDRFLSARFAAVASTLDDSDWLDVRRRAASRRKRHLLMLPLAATVGVLLVGSALALYGRVVDFRSAEPAPQQIVIEFDKLGAIFRGEGLGPNVISSEARQITSFVADGERRPLYVAPTGDGGFCWQWHFVGKCGRVRADEPSVGSVWLQGENGGAQLVFGHVIDSRIQRLELEYEDGSRADIPLVWVTPPIDAGFYQYQVPQGHQQVGRRTALLRALDDGGKEVAVEDFLLRP